MQKQIESSPEQAGVVLSTCSHGECSGNRQFLSHTPSASQMARIPRALTEKVAEPAYGQHESGSHDARAVSSIHFNHLHGPRFGNRIAHTECRGKRRLVTPSADFGASRRPNKRFLPTSLSGGQGGATDDACFMAMYVR
jgi:hypothetical protein